MKILRAKKKCGKCKYMADFPNIYCELGCQLQIVTVSVGVIYTKPLHTLDCTNKRQLQLTGSR